MASTANGTETIGGRVVGIGRLIGSIDRRLIQTFETVDRIGRSLEVLDDLTADGSDLVADLRERIDRMDARFNADMDELKGVLLAKLGDLDVGALGRRIDALEASIGNIETAVTRMDAVVEGTVEAAPDFVTKRVQQASEEVAEELRGA
jgi:hypothetical protein